MQIIGESPICQMKITRNKLCNSNQWATIDLGNVTIDPYVMTYIIYGESIKAINTKVNKHWMFTLISDVIISCTFSFDLEK